MSTRTYLSLLLVVAVGFIFFKYAPFTKKPVLIDEPLTIDVVEMNDEKEVVVKEAPEVKKVEKKTYQFIGDLLDVTKEKTVQGVNTQGKATGVSQANFADNTYELLATFKDLPDPVGTDFYEGWIVRKGLKFDVISTGKAVKVNGQYQNTFTSNNDLTDHDFYVLTIEPDDGDPAPAGHIVEGTMK